MRVIFTIIATMMLLFACADHENDTTGNIPEISDIQKNGFNKIELDEILDGYKKKDHFMGSVAISVNGDLVYSYVSGYSDYENGVPSTIDTKYRVASITKTFTALLVLKAIEEGKLSLNLTLDNYFPLIKNSKKITIKQMLNHSSGIHSYTKDKLFESYVYEGKSVEEMTNMIASFNSDFEPGSKEAYSNSNAYLLTLILEKIYKQSYASLINKKLTTPLKLNNTYFGGKLAASNGEAYSYQNHTAKVNRAREADPSVMLGAGGIISTPIDLIVLYHELFSGRVVSRESLDEMLRIERTYGLGIEKLTYAGKESYGHKGTVDEFNSIVLHNPESQITLSIIDNSSFHEIPSIVKDILNSYFKEDTHKISIEELDKLAGTYKSIVDPEDHGAIFEREGQNLILIIAGEYREKLIYKGNNAFLFDQSYAPAITFVFSKDGKKLKYKFDSDYRFVKKY